MPSVKQYKIMIIGDVKDKESFITYITGEPLEPVTLGVREFSASNMQFWDIYSGTSSAIFMKNTADCTLICTDNPAFLGKFSDDLPVYAFERRMHPLVVTTSDDVSQLAKLLHYKVIKKPASSQDFLEQLRHELYMSNYRHINPLPECKSEAPLSKQPSFWKRAFTKLNIIKDDNQCTHKGNKYAKI